MTDDDDRGVDLEEETAYEPADDGAHSAEDEELSDPALDPEERELDTDSAAREAAAEEQSNPDLHRDEPPESS